MNHRVLSFAACISLAACGGETSGSGAGGSAGAAATSGSAGASGSGANSGAGGTGATGGAGSGGVAGSGAGAGNGGVAGSGASAGTGAAAGSSGSAGNGGSAGVAGAAGSGGATSARECRVDGDCALLSDCCSCDAYPKDSPPPPICLADCSIPMCESWAVKEPLCRAGRCIAGADCDRSKVACFAPEPRCQRGFVPSVRGACWGPCVPVTDCAVAPDCAACSANGMACVTTEGLRRPEPHCVDPRSACGDGRADCACLGDSVCSTPSEQCVDTRSGVSCTCPAC